MKKNNRPTRNISFKEFCELETVRYWRQQLNNANIKNIQNESQLGGTRNTYTYGLLGFHNWLCDREFQYTTITHINKDMMQQRKISVVLDGIEHLLLLYMNTDSKMEFARLIKEYLGKIAFDEKPSLIKNSMYAIRSFFRENESEITFYFKPRVRSAKHTPIAPLSIETLQKILTVRNIQTVEKAVFLCKFQRGLDSSTFADRFNFDAWEQLVRHFGTDKYKLWDVTDAPVPIYLPRVKTGFLHVGFLDVDAVLTIIEYLKCRHDPPEIAKALFVNKSGKPISVNWISRRFHKLVARTNLQKTSNDKIVNQCSSHEMRDLLKSTLIDSGCRPDVADHVIGHSPRDSYEKQAQLYPESFVYEFSKASKRINIFSEYQKQDNMIRNHAEHMINVESIKEFDMMYQRLENYENRIMHIEKHIKACT